MPGPGLFAGGSGASATSAREKDLLPREKRPTPGMPQRPGWLRIAETQAKDVQIGQVVSVDTRNGVIAGRVVRIDPAVENGTVTVDVALEGELPRGARPDLTVDGRAARQRGRRCGWAGRR